MNYFRGPHNYEVNVIYHTIMRVRQRYFQKTYDTSIQPNIIAYLGSDQIRALHMIEYGDCREMCHDKFCDATVIEVLKDNYMHVVIK